MAGMTPSTALAVAVVDALVRAGVRQVVLCPGSRSAPLAYALRAREREAALRLWVRHDERVAGFTALGMGRAGYPAAVVTTSGTAAANLHPAVLEAHHAGVPLVVLTADRPASLRGTWANQTTELQAELFGSAVRARLDLAAADPALLDAALARALGGQGRRPGPVHLDLGFEEPLLPDGEPSTAPPPTAPVVAPTGSGPVTALPRGPRTVVLAGDGAGPGARLLAEAAGWPLLAEPSSGARGGPALVGPYRLLLELADLGGQIERVVVFGRPTLSRPVTRLLARADVELVLVSPYPDWPVPPRTTYRARAVRVESPAGDADDAAWAHRWQAAGAAAQRALDTLLDREPTLNGPVVARAVARSSGAGDLLVAASSNPIRDLDLAAAGLADGVRVVANRGLAGIDGTLSTATGIALGSGEWVRLLIGDLAFLHDANALLVASGEQRPGLQIVVLNDAGGGIFSLLEYGELAERSAADAAAFERLFGTPHVADLVALCHGFGVTHRPVVTVEELESVLAQPHPGTSVVEVRADRADLRRLHDALRAAVHGAARRAIA
jgi:2-succinyl-5-enolpyruvyl-6-hydroxy-3-cyclohexene-1-carboxylate synthase